VLIGVKRQLEPWVEKRSDSRGTLEDLAGRYAHAGASATWFIGDKTTGELSPYPPE
jgi:hypothetical protein